MPKIKSLSFPILILVTISKICLAQNDSLYYDPYFRETNKADAKLVCNYFGKTNSGYHAFCYCKEQWFLKQPNYFYKSIDTNAGSGWIEFNDSYGRKYVDAYFEKSRRSGIWKHYIDGSDKLWYVEKFSEGKRIELISYYPNGKVKREENNADSKTPKGKCYDQQGNEIDFTPFEKLPFASFDMQEYLGKTLHYPDSSRENDIEGRVIIRFAVDTNGIIKDIEIVKNVSPDIDAEAFRVISKMPKWVPGTQDDKVMMTYFTLPIQFKLEGRSLRLGKRRKKD